MDEALRPAAVDPPRGFFPARVDEKGRLKLPAAFQQYLNDIGEKRVFITTLDVATVRIYPNSLWKQNENFFDERSLTDPERSENQGDPVRAAADAHRAAGARRAGEFALEGFDLRPENEPAARNHPIDGASHRDGIFAQRRDCERNSRRCHTRSATRTGSST